MTQGNFSTKQILHNEWALEATTLLDSDSASDNIRKKQAQQRCNIFRR